MITLQVVVDVGLPVARHFVGAALEQFHAGEGKLFSLYVGVRPEIRVEDAPGDQDSQRRS